MPPTATLATIQEANSEQVRAFGEVIHAAGSIEQITNAVIAIATSRAWRDYDIAGHRASWLAAEFDYFLIANGVRYQDMVTVLKWRADAAALAPLTDPKSNERRTLKTASQEWDSPVGVTLIDLARQLGWITERGRYRKPPVGRRARARATGASREERARQARRERVGAQRCAELERAMAELAEQLDADECRICADALNMIAGHRDGGARL